jgi:hypothetical protein
MEMAVLSPGSSFVTLGDLRLRPIVLRGDASTSAERLPSHPRVGLSGARAWLRFRDSVFR